MNGKTAAAIGEMIAFFGGDVRRINHFLKVFALAKTIGEGEGLDPRTQSVLEVAAVTHDMGIKPSEEKYGSSAGHYQELEGPSAAEPLLRRLGLDDAFINRVCWLIGHHHTYGAIDGPDCQILVEADFLVNIYEDGMDREQISSIRSKIFRTKTGLSFLDTLYLSESPAGSAGE